MPCPGVEPGDSYRSPSPLNLQGLLGRGFSGSTGTESLSPVGHASVTVSDAGVSAVASVSLSLRLRVIFSTDQNSRTV